MNSLKNSINLTLSYRSQYTPYVDIKPNVLFNKQLNSKENFLD